jgi:hypothetical protein
MRVALDFDDLSFELTELRSRSVLVESLGWIPFTSFDIWDRLFQTSQNSAGDSGGVGLSNVKNTTT